MYVLLTNRRRWLGTRWERSKLSSKTDVVVLHVWRLSWVVFNRRCCRKEPENTTEHPGEHFGCATLAVLKQVFACLLDGPSRVPLFFVQGKCLEAAPLCLRSLAIKEKALGLEHPDVAASLNTLAELRRAQGKYLEAIPLCLRSLTIRTKTQGLEHPNVAQSLNTLAELYRAQGDYGKAGSLCERSLAIRKNALGPEHPDVAQSLNNLAELLRDEARYTEAIPLLERAFSIRVEKLGENHPDTVGTQNSLEITKEQVLVQLGRLSGKVCFMHTKSRGHLAIRFGNTPLRTARASPQSKPLLFARRRFRKT
ncbi:unnamed protein product [Pylaiella littoralis]